MRGKDFPLNERDMIVAFGYFKPIRRCGLGKRSWWRLYRRGDFIL